MKIVFRILLNFLPLFLWICFLIRLRQKPLLVAISVFLGIFIFLPCSFLQTVISPFFDNLKKQALGFFLYSIVVNGFLEEGSKFLPTLIFRKNSRKDFVFLAGTLGISLACFENLMYFLRFSGEYFFLRILFTLPLHLSCSLLTALIFTNKEKFRRIPFFHGMMIHGFFNFFAFFGGFFHIFSALTVLFSSFFVYKQCASLVCKRKSLTNE